MNFQSKGLFVSIVILIALLLVCHISNFLYPKNSNSKYNIIQFIEVSNIHEVIKYVFNNESEFLLN